VGAGTRYRRVSGAPGRGRATSTHLHAGGASGVIEQ
jgi:hypothetical protein